MRKIKKIIINSLFFICLLCTFNFAKTKSTLILDKLNEIAPKNEGANNRYITVRFNQHLIKGYYCLSALQLEPYGVGNARKINKKLCKKINKYLKKPENWICSVAGILNFLSDNGYEVSSLENKKNIFTRQYHLFEKVGYKEKDIIKSTQ